MKRINKTKRGILMYIVDHKFHLPNGDITVHQSEIITLVQHKQHDLMQNNGFLGLNLDTSPDKTCFTISVYWESKRARDASNLVLEAIQPNTALQQYCLEHEILQTKVKREVA